MHARNMGFVEASAKDDANVPRLRHAYEVDEAARLSCLSRLHMSRLKLTRRGPSNQLDNSLGPANTRGGGLLFEIQ
jgi:hypothetical protein